MEKTDKKQKNWTKTKAYKELKKDLLDDLEARGLIQASIKTK